MPHQSTYAGMKWQNHTKLPAASSQWNRRPVRERLNTVGHSSCPAKRQQDNRARPHPIYSVWPVLGAHPWYSKTRGPHPNVRLAGYAVITVKAGDPLWASTTLKAIDRCFARSHLAIGYDTPEATAINQTPPG